MDDNQAEYHVTHSYRRSPDPQGWIQTIYITQKSGDENFYFGMSGHQAPREKIERDIENGSLKEVPRSPIHKGETIWITPEQDIGIASATKPWETELRIIARDDVTLPEPTQPLGTAELGGAANEGRINDARNKEAEPNSINEDAFLNSGFWTNLAKPAEPEEPRVNSK